MSDKNDLCPRHKKCPLFIGEMLASKKAQEIYIRIFCKDGEKGRNRCIRYQIIKEGFKPTPDIMPNDDRLPKKLIENLEKLN